MSINKLPHELLSRICEHIRLNHAPHDEWQGKDAGLCCGKMNWMQPYRKDLRPLLTLNKALRAAALEQWFHTVSTNHDWHLTKVTARRSRKKNKERSNYKKEKDGELARRAVCQRLDEIANDPKLSLHVRKIVLCDRLFPKDLSVAGEPGIASTCAKWIMSLLAKFPGLQELSVNSDHRPHRPYSPDTNRRKEAFTQEWDRIFQGANLPKLRRVNFPQYSVTRPLCGNSADSKTKSLLTAMTMNLGSADTPLDTEPSLYKLSGMDNLRDLAIGWKTWAGQQLCFPIDLIDLPALRKFHLISCSHLDAADTEAFINRHDKLEAFCMDATALSYGSWEIIFKALIPCDNLNSLCFAGLSYELGPPVSTSALKMASLVSHRYEDYFALAELLRAYKLRRGDLDSEFLSWARYQPTKHRPVCFGGEYLVEYGSLEAVKDGIVFGYVGGTDGSDLTW